MLEVRGVGLDVREVVVFVRIKGIVEVEELRRERRGEVVE